MKLSRDKEGNPIEMIGCWTDVSERKKIELEVQNAHSKLEERVEARTSELAVSNSRLQHALKQLKQSRREVIQRERLSAIGELASGISHNLNNMLCPAVALIDLVLEEPGLSDQARACCEVIKTGTHDAAELVKRLGPLYSNQSETAEIIDLKCLIRETRELTAAKWRDEARKNGKDISCELQLENVPPIRGYASDLRQCLTNLLFNAVDAMPRGGVISIRLHNNIESAVITVSDNGRGMTEEVVGRIMEPFFTTKEGGAGLGLPMCAGVVDKHNGKLSVDSIDGHGTSFRIELPIQDDSGEFENDSETHIEPTTRQSQVLYIDDDPTVRASMSLLLEANGYRVDVAENGPAGIRKFDDQKHDFVISDFSMPDMNGRQVAEEIRRIAPSTVVLLITGWPEVQLKNQVENSVDCVEDAIIEKPVTYAKLHEAIERARSSLTARKANCVER